MRRWKVRLLQVLALYAPRSLRAVLHRWRGVRIGRGVLIGTDAIIETEYPELVWLGNDVTLGIRSTIIAHFHGYTGEARTNGAHSFSVRIEDEAFIGPGAIILPGVTIGRGAVVAAGSVVTSMVRPMIMVQGNPARAVARCGVSLAHDVSAKEFYRKLRPLKEHHPRPVAPNP